MKPVEKALQVRRNRHIKSPDPMLAYHRRVGVAREVWEVAEVHGSPKAKREARRLFLVAVAAGFELYWRDFIRILIDEDEISIGTSPQLGRIQFSLSEVQQIVGRKMSFGELVSCAYTFQSAEMVNRALSDIFSIDVFGQLHREPLEFVEVPRKNRSKMRGPLIRITVSGNDVLRLVPQIQRCFEIRHSTVHDTGTRYNLTQKETMEIEAAIGLFNTYLQLFAYKQAALHVS